MDRLANPEHSYPSLPNAPMNPISGPFYSQNGNDHHIPHDLSQIQASEGHRHHQDPHEQTAGDYQIQVQANAADDALRAQQHDHTTLAQHVMSLNNAQNVEDAEAANKQRQKVSRACDECRRKKIKCDATEASAETTVCSNCKRTGAQCRFSRVPMKRGPSKGYIKELADKITTLESRLGPYSGAPASSEQSYGAGYQQDFHMHDVGIEQRNDYGQQQQDVGRKRTHSMSERGAQPFQDNAYAPARHPTNTWGQDSPRHLAPAHGLAAQAPVPEASRPPIGTATWRPAGFDGQRENVSYEAERDVSAVVQLEWDEEIVDEYYYIVHQVFPLLPQSKHRLKVRLANCPVTLREAFMVALDCCIRSSPQSRLDRPLSDLRETTKKAAELIARSQYEANGAQSMSNYLVYMQTLILMALESDNHGPATMRGQVGPPRAEWLGRAIGMGTHLKLNLSRPRGYADDDKDTDTHLGRRIWWILFILDRWHACSTSCLLQLPEKGFQLEKDDQWLLGDSTYHLSRLSYIVGHVSLIMNESPTMMSATSPSAPIISAAILGEIDRFRESVETLLLGSPSLVHLCYWQVRLLIHRLTPTTTLHELLIPAEKIASILNNSGTMITPLNHHFAALASLTLTELVGFEETRPSAEAGIDDILQALTSRRGFMSSENSTGWDSAIRELLITGRQTRKDAAAASAEAGQHHGVALQHLADAAVGTPGKQRDLRGASVDSGGVSSAIGVGFDPTGVTRHGYLAALVQLLSNNGGGR